MAALWLLARPYAGARHDGQLYAGQILLQLYPEAMSQDLFFRYGSQDRYSIFSALVSRLCVAWGFAQTELVLLVCSLVAFVLALSQLLRQLEEPIDRWLALVSVATLSHLYGGNGIFAFAESFLTARTVAEPLAIAGLVALLRNRLGWCALLLGGALVTHPLIALPAIALAWVYLAMEDKRWLWAAALLGLAPLLGLAGIAPFTGLFRSFDDLWWEPVAMSNQHVFLTNWGTDDWQIVAFDFGVLALAVRTVPRKLGRLCKALLVTAATLLILTAIGADFFRNVLISALQAWRVLWLVHLLGLALAPHVLRHLWHSHAFGKMTAAAVALALVATNGRIETGWCFLLWACLLIALNSKPIHLGARLMSFANFSMLLAAIGISALVASRTVFSMRQLGFDFSDFRTSLLIAASSPALAIPLAVAAWIGWLRSPRLRSLIAIAAILLLTLAASAWDRRSEWIRFVENSMFQTHPFEALIPKTAQVYWPGDNMFTTWMLLKRPNYTSYPQGAGLLFNRETAIEFSRRARVLAIFGIHTQVCRLMAGLSEKSLQDDCPPNPEVLVDFCSMDRGPDFIVLAQRLQRGLVAEWQFKDSRKRQEFYLYDCNLLKTAK